MTPSVLKKQLERSIRRGRVLSSPAQLAGYDADGLGYKTFRPDAVVIPADADELVALLRDARNLDVPVTIRGAGTSLSGGPVAAQAGIVVHTSALKKVRTICREGFWCEVESSVVLNQLDEALRPHHMFYPPDPSSGPVCTLGGNVAMNAGGAHCFRYGVTGNYVLGLEAVLLDGSVHRFGGPAGGRGDWHADWKRLMVGSEGTLGAFTRFWLRTLPRPEKAWTFQATFPDLKTAERAIHGLVAHPSFPVAIELMDPRCVAMVENSPMAVGLPKDAFLLVTEIEGPAVLMDARVPSVAELLSGAGAMKVEYSDDEIHRGKLWKARKVAGGLMGQLSPDFLVQDAVIPKRALADVLQLVYDEADAAGLPAVNVFHAGDGNLHPNFLFDSRRPGELEKVEAISKRLMHRVVEVGGTLSGEHGIGNDKTVYMPLIFGSAALKMQLAVPAIFNPQHQLNPLKVFGGRQFAGKSGTSSNAASFAPSHSDNSMKDTGSRTDIGARPFAPFLDDVDGVTCVSASVTLPELAAQMQPHKLRFPLFADAHGPLCEQVAASEYAPASSRFGAFCDNIVGMNWQLPDGRVVRVGERVVKSTTGYDLLRFLLQSTGQGIRSSGSDAAERRASGGTPATDLGTPMDFVLRLRPDCGLNSVCWMSGESGAVDRSVAVLLTSCWMNWLDSADVVFNPGDASPRLRVAFNTPREEWPVFQSALQEFAVRNELLMLFDADAGPPMDGNPDFMLKTTPDRAIALARDISRRQQLRCVVLCYNGVVHGYLSNRTDPAAEVQQVVSQVERQLHEVGGDWRSRHLPRPEPEGVESQWLRLLETEFTLR